MSTWPPRPVGRPKKPETFKFARRRRRADLPTIIVPKITTVSEGLTGFVRGFNATDIEERFARALISIEIGFWFQYFVDTLISLPSYQRRIDFIVFWMPGKVVPVEIYGERWHTTAGHKDRDIRREAEINAIGQKYDWEPLEIVWGHDLQNQNAADMKVRELFL